MPSQSRLLPSLPWLKPPPKSRTQPAVTAVLKWFHPHNLPDDYPYRLDKNKPNMVPYFEWRGLGAPPSDVGYPGDVYLDLTPSKYALYACTTVKWVKWVGPRVQKEQLIAHPHIDGERFLRCSETSLGWHSIKTITDKRMYPKTSSASEALRTFIAHERGDPGHNVPKRRNREDEEFEDHILVKPRQEKRQKVADKSSLSEPSAGVGHLEKELQRIANEHKRLESELQKLQPEKSFSIEVGVKHERNYGSMSFDALCSLARTTDERIAENVSAVARADKITISDLRNELAATRENGRATKAELATVKSDRDRLKMKLEDFRSAIDAKMRQLDAD